MEMNVYDHSFMQFPTYHYLVLHHPCQIPHSSESMQKESEASSLINNILNLNQSKYEINLHKKKPKLSSEPTYDIELKNQRLTQNSTFTFNYV